MTRPVFVPVPERGRRFSHRRRVRLGDVGAEGRVRLDAVARYLQDVAGDDVGETDLRGTWVLRRTALEILRLPRYDEEIEAITFCSGTGSRWAERRTVIVGRDRPAVEAVAVWVYVDDDGRPLPMSDRFFDLYGESANGRRVSSRLRLPPRPERATTRPWPLRTSDFDVLGHVNNAVYWEALGDELARLAPHRRPSFAELEHRSALNPGDAPEVSSRLDADGLWVWTSAAGEARAVAHVRLSG